MKEVKITSKNILKGLLLMARATDNPDFHKNLMELSEDAKNEFWKDIEKASNWIGKTCEEQGIETYDLFDEFDDEIQD